MELLGEIAPAFADPGLLSSRVDLLAPLVLGTVGSLHCFLMCGPLACAAIGKGGAGSRILPTAAAYHLARVAAYALVGGVLGLAGRGAGRVLAVSIRPWVPWLLVIALLATALDLGKRIAPLPGAAGAVRALGRMGSRLPQTARAALLGAATPLLPCGLLYGLFAASAATSSMSSGALLLGAFALGAVPALLLAQVQTTWLRRLPASVEVVVRRLLPVVAALVIAVRAVQAARGGPPSCH